jgi:hypothetical protein
MAVTFVLGAAFLAIELHEFADMIEKGAGPDRSAFLSAFFALIGCHGLHVFAGAALAADDDGAGRREGLPRRHPAPHPLLQPVLAHPRHHLGRPFQPGLSGGIGAMSNIKPESESQHGDIAPGDEQGADEVGRGVRGYLLGFVLAAGPDRGLVLHHAQHAGLDAEHPDRALGAGGRADGRAPRLLPAHDIGTRTTSTT